jgi:hypothetical protein
MKVIEGEVQQRMGDHVRPFGGVAASRRMRVDGPVLEGNDPSVARTQVVALAVEVDPCFEQWDEERMLADCLQTCAEGLRGGVEFLRRTLAFRH